MTDDADRREQLRSVVHRYFAALDRGDVPATLACFADDATLSSVGQMELRGTAEIDAFLRVLVGNSEQMDHQITGLVIDPEAGRVAAELRYSNVRTAYAPIDMHNCNIFDVDADGRFHRVRFWVGDPGQLDAPKS